VTTPVLVIDTSYLLELFQIPGHSNPKRSKTIKARFAQAIKLGSPLFVPLPVVFELAKHIAGVRDGAVRTRLAALLLDSVASSIREASPWILIPAEDPLPDLLALCTSFKESYASQRVSLTDVCIVEEAKRLRRKYPSSTHRVHIWTTDEALKAHEPDPDLTRLPA